MKTPEISVLQAQKEIAVFGVQMQKMLDMVKELWETEGDDAFAKLFERIKKYEDESDKMENEIGKYLGQVSDAHLSDDTKEKIRGMNREIGELKRDKKVHFDDDQWGGVVQMQELVKGAMARMNEMLEGRKEEFTIEQSAEFERRINAKRNDLKQQSLADVDNRVYSYDNGTVYMDLVNELEKVGDYVLNVAEARLGQEAITHAE